MLLAAAFTPQGDARFDAPNRAASETITSNSVSHRPSQLAKTTPNARPPTRANTANGTRRHAALSLSLTTSAFVSRGRMQNGELAGHIARAAATAANTCALARAKLRTTRALAIPAFVPSVAADSTTATRNHPISTRMRTTTSVCACACRT